MRCREMANSNSVSVVLLSSSVLSHICQRDSCAVCKLYGGLGQTEMYELRGIVGGLVAFAFGRVRIIRLMRLFRTNGII